MDKNLNIKLNSDVKLLFVSDIHEHSDQFFDILNRFSINEKLRLVVCGDVLDKGYGKESAEKILDAIQDLVNKGHAYFIKGNHELKNIRRKRKNNEMSPLFKWLDSLPISLSFVYPNSSRITAVHAGVDSFMKWSNLSYNLDVCFIRYLSPNENKIAPIEKKEKSGKIIFAPKDPNSKLWHHLYDGRFGYIVSGHNSNVQGPMFYNYSCNIDTGVFESGKLTAVLFGSNGREEVYQAIGKAFLNEVK